MNPSPLAPKGLKRAPPAAAPLFSKATAASNPLSSPMQPSPLPCSVPPPVPPQLVEYHDYFLSKRLHCRMLSPQSLQIDAPFHLIEAAAARLHLPRRVAHEQAQSPSAYMRVPLWPAQLQRVAIGITYATSHALATAPASLRVYSATTRRWRTLIVVRVMGGLVAKIQARAAWRARCLCCLTIAAANSGGLQASVPRVPSPRLQGACPLYPLLSAAPCSLCLHHLQLTASVFAGCCRRAHR